MLDPKLREIITTAPEAYKPYDRYGEPIAGMSWIPLSGELQNGEFECFLLRMEPGSRSRPHQHCGFEEFMVLDGEFVDCDGSVFRSGDFVSFKPGSKHHSSTPGGCTLLVMLRGINRALTEDEL